MKRITSKRIAHWTNIMLFLRHLLRLLKEVGLFAQQNKAWWIIPLVLALLLLALIIIATQSATPYIYTLF